MEIHILGPIEALEESRACVLGGMRPRTLLAALVLAGDRGMSQREIRTALWGSAPPATVRAQVHTYVSRLRRALGGRAGLARAHDGYVLRLDGVTVDYRECLRLAAGARTACAEGRYDESSVLFAGALRQWQGPALAGATEFLDQQEGTRLEELRLSLLEEKADVDLGLGRGREVVDAFSPLAEKHPFRERMRAQLMTALYQCGRQADAIAVYQRGRAVLAEHLGVNPGETLESTFHALLAGNLSAARADVLPPAGPAVVTRVNSLGSRAELPSDLIDFAGRGAELAVLRRLLSGDRTGDRPGPVVITGVAGSGKSALAVRAAHRGEAAFPDGRFFLRFRDASGQSRPLQTVLDGLLEALGGEAPTGRQGQGPEDRLRLVRQRLAQGRRLIVLDGVGAEDPVDALVSVCGPNQVVITGRPRFAHLPGVRVLVLDALPHSEAVALLTGITDRATDGDPAAVERLVHLCERHPGALRAVAAQLTARPHWTPGRLADRLADPRRNMLDLLRIGGLDVGGSLRRHYAELPEALRRALRRLAMLRAHTISVWSAAAALDLPHEETEDVLERLVDAHMLTVTGVEQDGTFVLGLSRLLLCVLTGEVERTDPGQVPAEVAARVLASWRQRLADAGPLAPPEPAGAGTHPDGRFTGVLRSWPAGPFSGSAGLCRACVRELRATRTALRV
ncbi:AfsR/SARP family transcriptional regulator [Streptomyces yaizuensis]|uniref:Transcriptional regulator n=1 Tax=Streptomyces yaizuensis TaxID=2989713 RepID=A0ABQ5PAL4_9ACTN|nr:BTAD domain-containing putative transcriptional regulator [Streptomyces sp. YSPA8]GLF99627.1 transcriptional regulator [Streptomyces sp. YSPA8]